MTKTNFLPFVFLRIGKSVVEETVSLLWKIAIPAVVCTSVVARNGSTFCFAKCNLEKLLFGTTFYGSKNHP